MIVAAVDWTMVLTALIFTVPAIMSAVYARSAHRQAVHVSSQIETPSGKTLGEVAEYAHDTAIANNLLLAEATGETKTADDDTIRHEGETPPRIPSNGREA